jgi:hypothetical protein
MKKKVNLQLAVSNGTSEEEKESSEGMKQNLYLEEEEGPTRKSFKG